MKNYVYTYENAGAVNVLSLHDDIEASAIVGTLIGVTNHADERQLLVHFSEAISESDKTSILAVLVEAAYP